MSETETTAVTEDVPMLDTGDKLIPLHGVSPELMAALVKGGSKESNATTAPATSTPASNGGGNESETPQRQKKSPFRSSRRFVAGHILIEDTVFWYREYSSKLVEWMEKQYAEIAAKLGITSEQLATGNYEGVKPEEIGNLFDYIEAAYDFALSGDAQIHGLLADWDAVDDDGHAVPLTPANIADLALEVKTALIMQAQASTKAGSFATFRGGGN